MRAARCRIFRAVESSGFRRPTRPNSLTCGRVDPEPGSGDPVTPMLADPVDPALGGSRLRATALGAKTPCPFSHIESDPGMSRKDASVNPGCPGGAAHRCTIRHMRALGPSLAAAALVAYWATWTLASERVFGESPRLSAG